MGVVIIPSDFVEGKSQVVPICIQDHDQNGNAIAYGWIDAVVRAANGIRSLARTILLDEWRSSELADETVQELWAEHGHHVGRKPHDRVYRHAQWKALDKRAGGIRARKGLDTELLSDVLATLREPVDFTKEIEEKDFFERLDSRLAARGAAEVRELVRRALYDQDVDFETVFGKSKGAAKKQFQRTIGRVLRRL